MTVVDRDSVFEGTVPAIYGAYLVLLIFQPYAVTGAVDAKIQAHIIVSQKS